MYWLLSMQFMVQTLQLIKHGFQCMEAFEYAVVIWVISSCCMLFVMYKNNLARSIEITVVVHCRRCISQPITVALVCALLSSALAGPLVVLSYLESF